MVGRGEVTNLAAVIKLGCGLSGDTTTCRVKSRRRKKKTKLNGEVKTALCSGHGGGIVLEAESRLTLEPP